MDYFSADFMQLLSEAQWNFQLQTAAVMRQEWMYTNRPEDSPVWDITSNHDLS